MTRLGGRRSVKDVVVIVVKPPPRRALSLYTILPPASRRPTQQFVAQSLQDKHKM